MKTLQERKIQLAILEAQQEIMRLFVVNEIDRDVDAVDRNLAPIQQLFHDCVDRTNAYENSQFNDLPANVTVTGYCDDENISHYDIDKAIDNQNIDGVTTDSESSQFFAYCDTSNLQELTTFLDKYAPKLEYTTREDSDRRVFLNREESEAILEGVDVPSPLDGVQLSIDANKKRKIELELELKANQLRMEQAVNAFAVRQMTRVPSSVIKKHREKMLGFVEEDGDNGHKILNIKLINQYLNTKPIYNLERIMLMLSCELGGKPSRLVRAYLKDVGIGS